ncbi:hypothetical protein RRG08_021129 [Elysia crispata]|uniref:Uncharacterized protein n=1 Tax=Elysia crispata TaxID=231223 RepID=A0AAE1DAG6_9GAST|nr:hypothetical protein RRG08_021129 [Elysia crispata]
MGNLAAVKRHAKTNRFARARLPVCCDGRPAALLGPKYSGSHQASRQWMATGDWRRIGHGLGEQRPSRVLITHTLLATDVALLSAWCLVQIVDYNVPLLLDKLESAFCEFPVIDTERTCQVLIDLSSSSVPNWGAPQSAWLPGLQGSSGVDRVVDRKVVTGREELYVLYCVGFGVEVSHALAFVN